MALADRAADLEAARAGEHDVENGEVDGRDAVVPHPRERRGAVAQALHDEALRLEVDGNELTDLPLVVHDQNALPHAPPLPAKPVTLPCQRIPARTRQRLRFPLEERSDGGGGEKGHARKPRRARARHPAPAVTRFCEASDEARRTTAIRYH